jgi:hypothetical protein
VKHEYSIIVKKLSMQHHTVLLVASLLMTTRAFAQIDTTDGTFLHPIPASYAVKQAFEVESLVPIFFMGGYHAALGYRYRKFRFRISVLNGGRLNTERIGISNSSPEFKRYYKTSPGFSFGYNLYKHLELFAFVGLNTFAIEQQSSGIKKNIRSNDVGGGISYQFFCGKIFYAIPGIHVYTRGAKSVDFGDSRYHIPKTDISPEIRIGARLWKQY